MTDGGNWPVSIVEDSLVNIFRLPYCLLTLLQMYVRSLYSYLVQWLSIKDQESNTQTVTCPVKQTDGCVLMYCILWWITIWWIFLFIRELSWHYTHTLTNQVWSPLMCSLVDQVPEPKETQLSSVLPYSAGPAELLFSESVVEVSCKLMSTCKLHKINNVATW